MNVLPKITRRDDASKVADYMQALLRQYALIGGRLFGVVPKGHDRQFFCLDEQSWVWYEVWTDEHGKQQSLTTRYEVRSTGIYKTQNGNSYHSLSDNEDRNLRRAANLYLEKINAYNHSLLQSA